MLEELSVQIADLHLLFTDLSYRDNCRYIVFVFAGTIDQAEVAICQHEISEYYYHRIDQELPNPLYPRVTEKVMVYKERLN